MSLLVDVLSVVLREKAGESVEPRLTVRGWLTGRR